jgi:hypothetical protein
VNGKKGWRFVCFSAKKKKQTNHAERRFPRDGPFIVKSLCSHKNLEGFVFKQIKQMIGGESGEQRLESREK